MKSYARPKKSCVYLFGGENKCCVSCHHNSKWEYFAKDGCRSVALSNDKKGISMDITYKDFKQRWEVVEEDD